MLRLPASSLRRALHCAPLRDRDREIESQRIPRLKGCSVVVYLQLLPVRRAQLREQLPRHLAHSRCQPRGSSLLPWHLARKQLHRRATRGHQRPANVQHHVRWSRQMVRRPMQRSLRDRSSHSFRMAFLRRTPTDRWSHACSLRGPASKHSEGVK